MNAICSIHKVKFFRFLQPTLGYGNYIYDDDDQLDKIFKRISLANDNYHEVGRLNIFYDKVISRLNNDKYPFLHDITNIFDGKSKLFKDFRHPNSAGHKIIADKISEVIPHD